MKIISWNISCLPKIINPYMDLSYTINNIIKLLKKNNADIVCLQEVFDKYIIKILINELNNYEYFNVYNLFFWQDGLIIFSKHKILNKKYKKYKNYHGFENFISKGIISILIYNSEIKKHIWVHNTHLQASHDFFSKTKSVEVRRNQLKEINNYLQNNTFKKCYNIICGDFNIFYKDLKDYNFFFDFFNFNKNEIRTFPAFNKQFDYIIYNFSCKINYKLIRTDSSDHHLLISNFKI